MDFLPLADFRKKVIHSCSNVIIGKENELFKVLVCFLCSGHILIEDIPGTGKTMLLRAFAKTIGGSFKRVQFTPDVLPSDLTGINFYNLKTGEFEFRPGPLFASMVLADEINRATPRTQSSLLEAMGERQITVDGTTYPMAEPFMIMATQNPLESQGTFPLPDAQTDRFFMRISLGYMTREEEISVVSGKDAIDKINELEQQSSLEEISQLKELCRKVEVSEEVVRYLMDIVERTRNDSRIRIGVSTRGAIAAYRAVQAAAGLEGRGFALPEDIQNLGPAVFAHRLALSGIADTGEDLRILDDIIKNTPVPLENI
ncbi:MAG: AAA family ATPase [Oscillospiraceae bacterium]|nr:AAA family ATPase [Oscillospiraceae bacterium]